MLYPLSLKAQIFYLPSFNLSVSSWLCPGITIKKVSCNFSWETLLYYQPKEEICSDLSRCDSAYLVWCLGNCFMIFFFLPHDIFEKSNTYIHIYTHTIFFFHCLTFGKLL